MDVDQCSPLLWSRCELGLEELKHSLVSTTWELEMTILSARDEISRRECDVIQLKKLLSRAIKERDEAQAKCQGLQEEKLLLLKLEQQKNNATCISGSSESESNTGASSTPEKVSSKKPLVLLPEPVLELIADKPLPEKGRLLQAVMEAGPLLETVLLAGPLPQWQHPPPQLNFIDIPLVSISINASNHSQ